MLKIIKMISLYFLATAVCDSTPLRAPMHLAQRGAPMHHVTVTAYTTVPRCTDSNPHVTSSNFKIKPAHYRRIVALSKDLARKYEFGDVFNLWVDGQLYSVAYQDRMPPKHRKKVDLLLPSVKSCKEFGRNQGVLIPLDKT